MNQKNLLVWWLDSRQCKFLELALEYKFCQDLPNYVQAEIASASGKVGLGRLWVNERIGRAEVVWDDTKPAAGHAISCAGIAILESDAPKIWELVHNHDLGFLTDLNLNYKTF